MARRSLGVAGGLGLTLLPIVVASCSSFQSSTPSPEQDAATDGPTIDGGDAGPATPSIVFHASSHDFILNGNELTVGKPAGIVEGDLLWVSASAYSQEVSLPSGFTYLSSLNGGMTCDLVTRSAWKKATANEPETYTFKSSPSAVAISVHLLALGGITTTPPILQTSSITLATASGSYDALPASAGQAPALVLLSYVSSLTARTTTWPTPPGFQQLYTQPGITIFTRAAKAHESVDAPALQATSAKCGVVDLELLVPR